MRKEDKKQKTQCEGWRRTGGVFTLGLPKWEQCKKDAIVLLTVKNQDEIHFREFPACMICWKEAKERPKEIEIKEAIPLVPVTIKKEQGQCQQ